jgi:MRG
MHCSKAAACASQFNLPLPPELRELLISDWERSIKHSKPRPLPCKPVVADVLRGYVTHAQAGKAGNFTCILMHQQRQSAK